MVSPSVFCHVLGHVELFDCDNRTCLRVVGYVLVCLDDVCCFEMFCTTKYFKIANKSD